MLPQELGFGPICDADSHIMPTRAWLTAYADSDDREMVGRAIPDWETALEQLRPVAQRQTAALAERGMGLQYALQGPKSGFAPGALDPAERSEVLDALGLQAQIVLSTFVMPRLCGRSTPPGVAAAIARAHNRGIAEFCSGDKRMKGVGVVSLHDPAAALAEVRTAVDEGIAAVHVPTDAFWGRTPSHVDLEPLWAYCAAAGVPVLSHIGGGRLLPAEYHDDGRLHAGAAEEHGGEALRAKDFAVAHHTVERFLTCMVLDGVLSRHPDLRVGVIEQGASWVPGFLRHLDHTAYLFRRDPVVATLTAVPSDQFRRQVRITPYYFEDVGQLVAQLGPDMLMFGTDYPHYEGGSDPVGRLEASFAAAGTPTEVRRQFYVDNCARLFA